ncbi:MAG: TIR domain-containing protein [Lewinellaceae bacterium]|nr:TIR domain-containing protein [Lewinellaceae bacterium]
MADIFISYAWKDRGEKTKGSREEIVDQLCEILAKRGHAIRRDKAELTYKSDIKNFMEQIGAGQYVIAVVSDKYLRSRYCMFEAKEMVVHKDFANRVFPIVLPDAEVFSEKRIGYSKFWKKRLTDFSKDLDETGRDAATAELLEDEREIQEIHLRVQTFISEVERLNVYSDEVHQATGFADLIAALETKMQADGEAKGKDAQPPAAPETEPAATVTAETGAAAEVAAAPPETVTVVAELPVFPQTDVAKFNFDHALRPEFTRSVAAILLRDRRSVNAHAPKGYGRRRMAEDIAQALEKEPLHIVRVNLHNYISNYKAFLDDLASQVKPGPGGPDVCEILENGSRTLGKPILLILDNIDAVLQEVENKDPLFNGDFLNRLNGLKNGNYCRYMALSQQPHNEYQFDGVSSWLDVKTVELPDLSDRHIGAEIDRRLNPAPDKALRTYLVEQIETEPITPTKLLDDLLRYLESTEHSKDAAKRFILEFRKKRG